ncbi:MAG: response regulator [Planctomycetia bacterium]|nr:response regulator [Planctomycetia bacterium]
MSHLWTWLSRRFFSLRWKTAALLTLMVVLTAVLLMGPIRGISVERVLEHELVDLGDGTNVVAGQLRLGLLEFKEYAATLAAHLADAKDDESARRLFEEQLARDAKKQDGKFYFQAELFAFPADGKQSFPSLTKKNIETKPLSPNGQDEFLRKFATQSDAIMFSRVATASCIRAKDSAESPPRGADQQLVLQLAARVPIAAESASKSAQRFVLLTLLLSEMESNVPQPTSKIRLDQIRSSPRFLTYVIGPDQEMLVSPSSNSLTIPPAVADGLQILSAVARQQFDPKQYEMLPFKTEYAKTEARKLTKAKLQQIATYGWTYDDPRQNSDNLLAQTRFFCISKVLSQRFMREQSSPLETELKQLRRDHPTCRFQDPGGSTPRVKIRTDDTNELRAVQDKLTQKFSELRWDDVSCEHYAFEVVRVQFGAFDAGHYFDVAIASSLEEITSDIEVEIWVWLWRALWLIVGTIGLATWLSLAITRPLGQITASTEKIAAGNYDVSALPVRDRSEIGALARSFQKMVTQIQERNSAIEEADLRNRSVVRLAAEGIILCSATGQIQEINDAALRIFGYSFEETKDRSFDLLLEHSPEEDGGLRSTHTLSCSSAVSDLAQTTTPCTEKMGQHKDGSLFPLEVSVSKVKLPNGTMLFTVIARDITERKRLTSELKELNDRLEQRVKRRTAELEQKKLDLEAARDQALEASHAKSAFLAQMSHELRTPLNSIIGYSELLMDDAKDGPHDPTTLADLKKIVGSGHHLLALINDVLDVSKIEAGKMELCLEEFELAAEVRGIVTTIEPLVQKNANTLRVDCPTDGCVMRADRTRVRQVLFNLLSNACKFTDHGQVALEATVDFSREACRFRVTDTGIGMSAEQLTKLFQSFSQADASTTRKYGGTGLGLAISQRICHLMGGQITVTSELGVGSTFTVDLPLRVTGPTRTEKPNITPSPVDVSAVTQTIAKAATTPGQTVLVIDDDPTVREVLQRILTREGLQVVLAESGEEGLRLADTLMPAVITLDVMMPHMDGWEVLGRLKGNPRLRHIPVVMLSIVDDKQFGFALGATDYLTKPIDRERLISVLRKYLPETSPTVLIIEDDPDTRDLLRRTLASEGWKTFEAENGRDGLDCLSKAQPSLILLDLMMPLMDGFQFLSELRRHPHWSGVPVLVITAMELSPNDQDRLNGRVMQILRKGSYKLDELVSEVKRALPAERSLEHAETVAGGR